MDCDLGFKRTSYGLFKFTDFCWFATFDRSNSNREHQIASHFFRPKFFILDLKVHHSNSMRLTFCHGLSILQTQILTSNKLEILIDKMGFLFFSFFFFAVYILYKPTKVHRKMPIALGFSLNQFGLYWNIVGYHVQSA